MPHAPLPQLNDEDFPPNVTPAERTKALTLIGISKKDINNPDKSLSEKLNIPYDNSAMLDDNPKNKKITTAERIRTLFQQEKFSPLTRLLRLVKIEEAKLEAYNRAVSYGLEPRLLSCLPQPDKKFYATLLLQLVKYEVPELKSVEISGNVEAGMTVVVVNQQPMQKVVKVDANAPEKLKKLFGQSTQKALTLETQTVAVEVEDY